MTNELPTTVLKVNHHPAKHIAARYAYAAFGSNLKLAQMAERCPDADVVCAGKLPGHRLVFAKVKSVVPVGIYKLSTSDIEKLDRFEGMGNTYDRYLVTVLADDGTAKRCFTYIKKSNREAAPSKKYYARVAEGYADWNFDDRRLRHARKRAEAASAADVINHEKNAEDMWHDWMNGRGGQQHSFGSVDRRGRVRVRSTEPVGEQMQFSLVTGRCRKCGTTHETPVCPSLQPKYMTVHVSKVDWGQRDGLMFWRIRGERAWYLDVTKPEDETTGMVRGQLATNLPGAKAFTPKDKR
jgi:hypothetical protein